MNRPVPISAQELRDVRNELKRLDQILAGLEAQAEADEGRITPAGEPTQRPYRLR